MPNAFMSGVTMMAPMRPVHITRTAVSAGSPPSCSPIPIAMPAVTDLGAKEASTTVGAPKSVAMPSAERIATIPPARRALAIGRRLALT
jgi:hypothetical protein